MKKKEPNEFIKNEYAIVVIVVILLFSGCASFKDMEAGLNEMNGKDKQVAFEVLGYPDYQQHIDDKNIYVWKRQNSGTIMVPQQATTTGNVGTAYYQQTTNYSQPVSYSNNCVLKIVTDSMGTIIDYEYKGNSGGCYYYMEKLKKYNESN